MNAVFNNINIITSTNKSQKKQNKNYLYYLERKGNIYLSENKRNLTKKNSQKKIKRKESYSNNKNNINNKAILFALNNNNIRLKNYSNLLTNNSKGKKINNKNKINNLSKPKLEIEINNRNSSNNASSHYSRKTNNQRYKKNISEYDLINSILNTFTNYNLPKGNNINLNYSSSKKCSYDKNIIKKHQINNNKNFEKNKIRHASDTKLLRSSSGYSYINNHLAQTNSFFNGNNLNQLNQLGYISTWGNNPNVGNNKFSNIIINNKKKNNNRQKNKNNKSPIIGKIIKNYKNNDLNCIFNMNLIQPTSQINNQDYFKYFNKNEYETRNKKRKNKNKKESHFNEDKQKEENIKINNDEFSNSKNTMTKTSEISRNKKYNNIYNDSPEEIHFYIISYIQNGKKMEKNLVKK